MLDTLDVKILVEKDDDVNIEEVRDLIDYVCTNYGVHYVNLSDLKTWTDTKQNFVIDDIGVDSEDIKELQEDAECCDCKLNLLYVHSVEGSLTDEGFIKLYPEREGIKDVVLYSDKKLCAPQIFNFFVKGAVKEGVMKLCNTSDDVENSNDEEQQNSKKSTVCFDNIDCESIANQIALEKEWYKVNGIKDNIADEAYDNIVYVSHAYGGKSKNVKDIENIVKAFQKEHPTYLFISPVHTFGYLYGSMSYKDGLERCLWLLKKCDEMWIIGDNWQQSTGVQMEIYYALENDIPIVLKGSDKSK